jgi:hypothetical protein
LTIAIIAAVVPAVGASRLDIFMIRPPELVQARARRRRSPPMKRKSSLADRSHVPADRTISRAT